MNTKTPKPVEIVITLDNPMLESTVAETIIQADATKMHNNGLAKALYYGFQRYCNDGTSPDGKDTPKETRIKLGEAKRDKLMTGEIDRVTNPADPYARLRKFIRAILRKNKAVHVAAKDAGVKHDAEFVDAFFADLTDESRDAVLKRAEKMWTDENGEIELETAS